MNRVEEQQIKDEMHRRELPDSIEFTCGTPSKGSQISIKCYTDFTDKDLTDAKSEGLLKARQYLIEKGVIQ